METKTTVEDMTTLSPKEMATRLTEKHYAIIISGLKADGKKMQLVYGEKARKAALLTVQQILNVYGPDEWEAKGYFDLVEQEIEQMANWPYVNSQNK